MAFLGAAAPSAPTYRRAPKVSVAVIFYEPNRAPMSYDDFSVEAAADSFVDAATLPVAPDVRDDVPPIPYPFAVGLLYMLIGWAGLLVLLAAKSALEMLYIGSLAA